MIKQSIQGALPRAADRGASVPLHVAVAQEAFRDNEALLAGLDSTPAGLDEGQIAERLARDGINEVSHEKPPH